jgi:xanthine/uracil/vitamin C permease (AzgA family)
LAYRYRIQLPMAWRLALSGYAIIKAFSGRGREISWLIYMLAVVLVLYCAFVRRQIG